MSAGPASGCCAQLRLRGRGRGCSPARRPRCARGARRRWLCAALGVAGVVTGAGGAGRRPGDGSDPDRAAAGVALGPLVLAPDRSAVFFLVVAGAVGRGGRASTASATPRVPAASRTAWAAFAVFLLGMQLVPAAGDVGHVPARWELMALGSTVLLLAEHRARAEVVAGRAVVRRDDAR